MLPFNSLIAYHVEQAASGVWDYTPPQMGSA